jgi:hypothetical protein
MHLEQKKVTLGNKYGIVLKGVTVWTLRDCDR